MTNKSKATESAYSKGYAVYSIERTNNENCGTFLTKGNNYNFQTKTSVRMQNVRKNGQHFKIACIILKY